MQSLPPSLMKNSSPVLSPEQQAILDVHTTWIDAVNAGELSRLHAMMTDDVVLMNPTQPPFGWDGLSANFTSAQQTLRVECASELEEVVVVGSVAYTRSHDTVTATPRTGGETTQFAGYRMTIYRQQADGRWLLARDVHTLSEVKK